MVYLVMCLKHYTVSSFFRLHTRMFINNFIVVRQNIMLYCFTVMILDYIANPVLLYFLHTISER